MVGKANRLFFLTARASPRNAWLQAGFCKRCWVQVCFSMTFIHLHLNTQVAQSIQTLQMRTLNDQRVRKNQQKNRELCRSQLLMLSWLAQRSPRERRGRTTPCLRQLPSMPKIAAFHVIRLNPLVKRQRAWESHVPRKEVQRDEGFARLESCNVSAGRA